MFLLTLAISLATNPSRSLLTHNFLLYKCKSLQNAKVHKDNNRVKVIVAENQREKKQNKTSQNELTLFHKLKIQHNSN